MLKLVLLLFLSLPFAAKADDTWKTIDTNHNDLSFVAGYVSASVYDLSEHKHNCSQLNDTYCSGWKVGLGLIAGLGVAIGRSQTENIPIQFSDIVFGGIGGLTCVVLHF